MNKKNIRLQELSDFARKQLQRKKKFALVNNGTQKKGRSIMASFFYPQLDKKEKSKLLSKTSNYVYMAKMTQELAKRYNMEPIEFQAAIWCGIIKDKKGENYDITFLNAIDKNLKKLNVKIEELKKLDNFMQKVVEVIGNSGI